MRTEFIVAFNPLNPKVFVSRAFPMVASVVDDFGFESLLDVSPFSFWEGASRPIDRAWHFVESGEGE